ncbi:hypothetical protein KC939_02680, partial [Candidatus Saccharibacteria bacterium]|nr:hypothetical protein [Candidatus Saccharibacteria bacterium]
MSFKKTVAVLVFLAVAAVITIFFINQKDSDNVGGQTSFKAFMEARQDLRECRFRRAYEVLDIHRENANNLAMNPSRPNGISRWVYFHDFSIAAYGSGKKIEAKRLAAKAIRLYDDLAFSDSVKNIHTPPGPPYFEQMLDNLVSLSAGKGPIWPSC